MDISGWIKPGVIVGIIGVIVAIIGVTGLPNPIPPPDDDLQKTIADEIQTRLNDKIKNDALLMLSQTEDPVMMDPFHLTSLKNDAFTYCETEESHDKCELMLEIRKETDSQYVFIFPYPNRVISEGESEYTISHCVIEIIAIDSQRLEGIDNNWDDREWCEPYYLSLLTNQYVPRGMPVVNVNSLVITYFDSEQVRWGIVNAYHLENLLDEFMKDYEHDTFNVLLLDSFNCVSGAVSKVNGITTTHLDEGLWQLDTLGNKIIIKSLNTELNNQSTNCPKDSEFNLDAKDFYQITVNENSGSINTSKLNGEYQSFEIREEVTSKDLDMLPNSVRILHDWHLLVSVPEK